MKKTDLRVVAVAAIVLVLYHLIVFLIPFAHTATFWVSYGFTLVAFGVVCGAMYTAFGKNKDAVSRFYGFPIARIGVVYGTVQVLLSLIAMLLGQWIPWWVALLVYAVGMSATGIGLIGADTAVEQIQQQDAVLKKDVFLMRSLQSKVIQMANTCEAAQLKALAEEFRYSDPVSNAALTEIEADLSAAVDELQAAVVDGDQAMIVKLCGAASAVLGERNRLCKLNKS